MLWTHPDHPDRAVRLAYCLNVHASEDFGELLDGMRSTTLPLAQRLGEERPFGVGMYFAGGLARRLARPEGKDELATLTEFLREHTLDPFTFNAFPFGGFHGDRLKRDVFEPTWLEEDRAAFTRDVAIIATHLARELKTIGESRHVSISTHTGAFGATLEDEGDSTRIRDRFREIARELARMAEEGAPRIVLSLEPEPRASCGDTRELERFQSALFAEAGGDADVARTHLGTCLDCCHAAVEFEDPADALRDATAAGGALGKLQFSSAIRLNEPGRNESAVKALLDMHEPRYLHQVTGRTRSVHLERLRLEDLPQLEKLLAMPGAARTDWLDAAEWRCHFHVPVDLEELFGTGLATTRHHADRLLALALADPRTWNTNELHLEIETYTWDVLPGAVRGSGDLVDGLEREYRHTIALLEAGGWQRA